MSKQIRRTQVEGKYQGTAENVLVPVNSRAGQIETYMAGERILTLFTQVDAQSAERLVVSLKALAAADPTKEITLLINSPGGEVYACLAILEAMDEIPCDIKTVCLGYAASAASVIFAHGTKGKRFIGPKSTVLIHQPSGTKSGKSTDLEDAVAETTRLRVALARSLASDSGQTPEDVEADGERDLWLNCDQAIEYGVADAILPQRRKSGLPEAKNPPSERAAKVLAARKLQKVAPLQSGQDGIAA